MGNNRITIKQERFLNIYLETGNASEAYRQAYSCGNMKDATITRKAFDLLHNGKIRAIMGEIQRELKKTSDIKKEAILEELSCIVFSDIRDYVSYKDGKLQFKNFDTLTDKQARAIESIKKSKTGIEIKLHGKSWSIERLCKMLGFETPQNLNLMFDRLPEDAIDQIVNKIIENNG